MTDTQAPPTLDEVGLSGDVEDILADAEKTARSVITEPEERWKQQSNLIRSGDTKLPERVRVWRYLNGEEAWLPTATIRHHMKKRHSDGTPVFVKSPEKVRDGARQEPIDRSCDVCAQRNINKKFFNMFDYEGHMDAFHPREWESIRRDEDRRERREERELLRQLVEGKSDGDVLPCPIEGCDFEGTKRQLQGHRMGAHRGDR